MTPLCRMMGCPPRPLQVGVTISAVLASSVWSVCAKKHRSVDRCKDHTVAFALQIRKSQFHGGKELRFLALFVFDEYDAQRRNLPYDLQLLCPRHDHDGKHTCLLQGQNNAPDDWNTTDFQQRNRVFFTGRRDYCAHRTESHVAHSPSDRFLYSITMGRKWASSFAAHHAIHFAVFRMNTPS